MEYYLNFAENGKVSVSAENPDNKAAMTIIIRSGSTSKIGELLTEAKSYVASHDVLLESITASFNKIAMGLGYQNLNTTMVSSILEYRRD